MPRILSVALVLVSTRAALADDPPPAPAVKREAILWADVATRGRRAVAEDFLVLPSGLDVGMQLRSVNADGGVGMGKVKLTDLALFDMQAQWAVARHFELDASISVLPKQPSTTSEPVFQGGGLTLRRDLFEQTAIAIAGTGSPLLGMGGMALGSSLFVEHKHRLNEIVSFAIAGGATSTFLRPTTSIDHPYLVEGAGRAEILARVPDAYGAWLGITYAVPAYHRGHDPVSGMALDPQPRLDIDIGNSVKLEDHWDFSVELSIIDRGDLANPATRLPILDGGFDQIQIIVGVSRRFADVSHRGGIRDPLLLL